MAGPRSVSCVVNLLYGSFSVSKWQHWEEIRKITVSDLDSAQSHLKEKEKNMNQYCAEMIRWTRNVLHFN